MVEVGIRNGVFRAFGEFFIRAVTGKAGILSHGRGRVLCNVTGFACGAAGDVTACTDEKTRAKAIAQMIRFMMFLPTQAEVLSFAMVCAAMRPNTVAPPNCEPPM